MLLTSVWICPFFIKTQWLLIGFPIFSAKFRSNYFDNVSGSLSDPYAIQSIRYPIYTVSDLYAIRSIRYPIHTLPDPYAIWSIRYLIHTLSDPYAIQSIRYPIYMVSDPYAIWSIRYLIHTLSDPYVVNKAEVPINLSRKTIEEYHLRSKWYLYKFYIVLEKQNYFIQLEDFLSFFKISILIFPGKLRKWHEKIFETITQAVSMLQ